MSKLPKPNLHLTDTERKRILRVLRPFAEDAQRLSSTHGYIVVNASDIRAAAKLYKDLGGK